MCIKNCQVGISVSLVPKTQDLLLDGFMEAPGLTTQFRKGKKAVQNGTQKVIRAR
jgi:hypothetical protein